MACFQDLLFSCQTQASTEVPSLQASAHFILPTIPWFHLNQQCLSINPSKKMDVLYQVAHSSPAKRKVLGDLNNLADSPLSPTANLKLLTKVASQVDSLENVCYYKGLTETPPSQCQLVYANPNCQGKTLRKYKSLGFLCDKFLKLYPLDLPDGVHVQILLTELANQLGVEKRRIYDIINVVESLQMATKVGKNSYTWTGRKKLADTFSQLKLWAEQVGLVQFVRSKQINRKLYLNLHQGELESIDCNENSENPNISNFFRNERRIGILCQKFVMLFLVSLKDGVINLDLAAEALVGKDCQQNKTRLRRLYDIANILVSLGIIEKLDLMICNWKKPVFQYVGPPLHNLEYFNSDNSLLSNLVKTELSDSVSSDLSEDSCEPESIHVEIIQSRPSVTETDHSYSLDLNKLAQKAVHEPPAKKRLVFCRDETMMSSNDDVVPAAVTTSPTTVFRVMDSGSTPQSITNGGVYKAVKVGNGYHLVRVEQSS